MARLNEPPVAPAAPATALAGGVGGGVESVDALKRRFIRQNRELAKNNSTQSLRIRSLEIEVSRLLQTNLELREELLRSRNAEHDARKQSSKEGVRGFKEEMMAKLKELSGIVEGIEDVQKADDDVLEKEERRMSVLSQMEFRERQPLADLMRDCQMPTIAENKIHPRRTLEPEEIRAVRLSDGSSNGSPDLGPPPVARFDCQDPIKFDSVTVEDRQETPVDAEADLENKQQDEELPANLSINLETRRKRKDGQPRLEMRRASILPPPSPTSTDSETSAPTLRTGAKRKLADRDLDKPAKGPSQTDFTFNRKTNTEPTKTDAEPLPQPEEKLETVEIQPPAPQSARKVLGDKSVNMSPRKATAQPEKPEKDDVKKPAQPKLSAVKDRSRARRSRLSAIPPPPPEPEVSVATIELPTIQSPAAQAESGPNTPAAHDFFSPTPSQPSAGPNERAPTPPPTGPSSATTEATRPSRRARSAVNYAEPSLNAKMRRQEKNMMDAVTGLQHHRHAMSTSAERKPRSSITVKEEPKDGDAWKSLPETGEARRSSMGARARSPLEAKSGELTNLDSLVRPESDGHGHGLEQKSNQTEKGPSLATSKNSLAHPANQESTTGPDTDLDDAARKLQELDLYDFKDSSSSPATASSAVGSSNSTTERAPAAKSSSTASRAHRRHSSIPKEVAHASGEPARASGRTASAAATSSSRRRSMMT